MGGFSFWHLNKLPTYPSLETRVIATGPPKPKSQGGQKESPPRTHRDYTGFRGRVSMQFIKGRHKKSPPGGSAPTHTITQLLEYLCHGIVASWETRPLKNTRDRKHAP